MTRACQSGTYSILPVGKKCFFSPTALTRSPLPTNGLTIVLLIKYRLLVLNFKGPLQFSQLSFPLQPVWILLPQKAFTRSFHSLAPSFIHTFSHFQAGSDCFQQPLLPSKWNFIKLKLKLVVFNDHLLVFPCFYFEI